MNDVNLKILLKFVFIRLKKAFQAFSNENSNFKVQSLMWRHLTSALDLVSSENLKAFLIWFNNFFFRNFLFSKTWSCPKFMFYVYLLQIVPSRSMVQFMCFQWLRFDMNFAFFSYTKRVEPLNFLLEISSCFHCKSKHFSWKLFSFALNRIKKH